MKKLIIVIGIVIATLTVKASDDAYFTAMKQQLTLLDSAKTEADLQQIANVMERIAAAEAGKWHPAYYNAYIYLNIAFRQSEMKARDSKLDIAQQWIEKAKAISTSNAEILALEGYIYMIKISIDPAGRGQTLAPKTTQILGQAVVIDPQNPRAMYLMAQMSLGSARFFGTSTDEACSMATNAVTLFESKKDAEDMLAPHWGYNGALKMKQQCEQPASKGGE